MVEEPETKTELDSHFDIWIVGRHALVIQHYNKHVNLSAYYPY